MKRAAWALLWIAGSAAAQVGPGVDFRVMWRGRAIARGPAHIATAGDPVRVLLADGTTCDGTLGPDVDTSIAVHGEEPTLTAPIRGCARRDGQLAILRPPPRTRWPRAIEGTDPRAVDAIALAREAVASAGHLHGEATFDPPRVYALGDALYVLVTVTNAAAAVARVREGRAEIVIARPAHSLWTHEELVESRFDWWGVVDLDGDGTVELLERQVGESAFMLRAVRIAARPEGDVVWLASYRDDPADASIDRAPRPVAATR